MGMSRQKSSPIPRLAPWVALLIVGIDASRMSSGHRLPPSIVLVAFATVAVACGGFLVLGRFVGQFTCPGCHGMTLRRLVRHPRFFKCSACGQRVQQDVRGGWHDARGPLFDGYYRARTGNWLDAPIPDADGSTCGTLLGRKRFRDRSLLAFVRDRRKPWPGPGVAPGKGGPVPVAGESTCGALLRSKKSRDRVLRGEGHAGVAVPSTPPLWDRWLDR